MLLTQIEIAIKKGVGCFHNLMEEGLPLPIVLLWSSNDMLVGEGSPGVDRHVYQLFTYDCHWYIAKNCSNWINHIRCKTLGNNCTIAACLSESKKPKDKGVGWELEQMRSGRQCRENLWSNRRKRSRQ